MTKTVTKRDDGRATIYYSFDDEPEPQPANAEETGKAVPA
jgi:hypothetical protein